MEKKLVQRMSVAEMTMYRWMSGVNKIKENRL